MTLSRKLRILKGLPPTGKTDCMKPVKPILANRLLRLGHQPAIIGDVMDRQQGRAEHLLRQKEVVDISPAEIAAGITQATGLNWCRISLVDGIAKPKWPERCKCRGIAAIAGGEDAIEHVDAGSNGGQD